MLVFPPERSVPQTPTNEWTTTPVRARQCIIIVRNTICVVLEAVGNIMKVTDLAVKNAIRVVLEALLARYASH